MDAPCASASGCFGRYEHHDSPLKSDGDRLKQLYIEFDHQQIAVRTDIPALAAFFADSYRHMLVPRADAVIGNLAVYKEKDGVAIEGSVCRTIPGGAVEHILPYLKNEVHLLFMRARPDLLWLHGGCVERDGHALLLAGPSGQGKSTLTTLLCESGWRFLSDDIAPVLFEADVVLPFAQTPSRRVDPGHPVDPLAVAGLARDSIAISHDGVNRNPVSIGAIIYLKYSRGVQTHLEQLDTGTAAMELLKNATNFADHKGEAVRRAAEMARRVPAYSLQYGDSKQALEKVTLAAQDILSLRDS